ncbi:MAG TPA: glycosyltransferase [Mycobacteriales bacterium]|jgi:glycosyltransferase involved in cell wall biosynthesis/tetratricopeptide (TPR) repeat protein|nr:glycosyltransferase [Mycobacteriales bacterium]
MAQGPSFYRRLRRKAFRAVDRAGLAAVLPMSADRRARIEESRLRRDARLAFSAGDRDRARALLETVTTRYEGNPETWDLYARVLERSDGSDEAVAAARRVLRIRPDSVAAADLLITLLGAQGRHDEIGPVLDGVVAGLMIAPADRAVALGEILPLLGRYDRLPEAQRVLAAHPAASGRDPLRLIRVLVALHERVAADPGSAEAAVAELTAGLPPLDRAEVAARFAIHTGDAAEALRRLESLPDARLPLAEVRREARHLAAEGRLAESMALSAVVWAHAAETDENGMPGARTLLRRGFPFDPPAPEPVVEPNPRRVLYLLHNSLPWRSAGYATRTHGLLVGLRRAGWDVDGVTRLGFPHDQYTPAEAEALVVPDTDVVDEVPYRRLVDPADHRMPKKPLYDFVHRYADRLERLARAERPAILHGASNHWNGLAAGVVAGRLGIPYVYEVRGLWEVTRGSREPGYVGSPMYNLQVRMEADAAARADRVIAITGALRDEMVRRGVPEDHIVVVPNGVDTTRFTPLPRDGALAAQLGMTGKTVIGYVGSVLDYEGLELMMDAVAALAAERDDFAVLVVGDGTAYPDVVARAQRLGLGGVVTFTGRVPHADVERYYSVIDIAPFPRLPLPVCEMVSPLKPFEAMAMAKTVVVSDVAALAEIVTDGVNGLQFAKGDVASLTATLRRLLDEPELRTRLAEAGRDWVRAERDWTGLAARVDAVYADILSARRPTGGDQTTQGPASGDARPSGDSASTPGGAAHL